MRGILVGLHKLSLAHAGGLLRKKNYSDFWTGLAFGAYLLTSFLFLIILPLSQRHKTEYFLARVSSSRQSNERNAAASNSWAELCRHLRSIFCRLLQAVKERTTDRDLFSQRLHYIFLEQYSHDPVKFPVSFSFLFSYHASPSHSHSRSHKFWLSKRDTKIFGEDEPNVITYHTLSLGAMYAMLCYAIRFESFLFLFKFFNN